MMRKYLPYFCKYSFKKERPIHTIYVQYYIYCYSYYFDHRGYDVPSLVWITSIIELVKQRTQFLCLLCFEMKNFK